MTTRKKCILWGGVVCLPLLLLGVLLFSPLGVILTRIGMNSVGGIHIGASSGQYWNQFTFSDIDIHGKRGEIIRLKRLAVDWQPLALWKKTLHIKRVELDSLYMTPAKAQEVETAEKSTAGIQIIPPFSIVLDQLVATNFFYDRGKDEDGDPQTSCLLDRMELSATAGRQKITLAKFQAEGPDMAANLRGTLLIPAKTVELGGTFRFAGFGFHSMAGELAVSGSSDAPDVAVRLHTPGTMTLTGRLHNLLTAFSWNAELAAENFDLSAWIRHCPQILIEKGSATMQGDLAHYQGHALLHGNWGAFDQLRLEGDLAGNDSFIDFATLSLRREKASLTADGAWISWEKIFDWRGEVVAKDIDPSLFESTLQGQLDAVFQTRGEIFAEDLEGVFEITELKGILHGQPVSVTGDLTLHEDWLDTRQLEIRSGVVEGVAIVGPAQLRWAQQPGWTARVLLEKCNPAFLFPDFPGEIDGELRSRGQFAVAGQPLSANLRVERLSGRLRGQALSGSGSLDLADNFLTTEGLALQLGDSSLHLGKGGIGTGKGDLKKIALTGNLHFPDIAAVIPGAKGSLDVDANVKGTRSRPETTLRFAGENLAWQGKGIDSLAGNMQLEWAENGRTEAEIDLVGLSLDDISLRQLSLQLDGQLDNHRLTARVEGGKSGTIPFAASLIARGKGLLAPRQWRGELTEGKIELANYGNWQQQEKASLRLAEGGFALENVVLNSRLGTLAGNFSGGGASEPSTWQADVRVSDMELMRLGEVLQWPFSIKGLLQAELALHGDAGMLQTGAFDLNLPETVFDLSAFSGQNDVVTLRKGRVSGELQNGLLQLTGGFEEGGGGRLEYHVQLLAMDNLATISQGKQPLSGTLSCRDFDVAMLGNFLSYGQPFGKLNAELAFGGILIEPQISGELSLAGGVGLLAQGISLTNPEITLDADSEGMQLQARAKSGDGFVKIAGRLGYGQLGQFGRLQIRGRNFLAVDQPEYSFVVNPDMSFHFNEREGSLTGQVAVVSGIIEPNNFTDTVSASDDVVIVQQGKNKTPGWLFYMDVDVDLGSRVTIDGYGLSGGIGGTLAVKKAPEELFSGTGTLELNDGKFSMYGRSLDITRGNIIFSGGPVDNPGVDVRAEKSMSDRQALGEGYTVGVDISGLVQNLQYRLFSTPPMSETEILSYMILGHSLAGSDAGDESILASAADTLGLKGGTAFFGKLGDLLSLDDVHLEGSANKEDISLVVGKHLTKDIYVGYDVNMYSQLGQFWVRYDLGKGFSVQTFSSAQSTGADLLFSFEK